MRFSILSIVLVLLTAGAAFGAATTPEAPAPEPVAAEAAVAAADGACSAKLPAVDPTAKAAPQGGPFPPPSYCSDRRACNSQYDCGWDSRFGALGECLPASHSYCPGYDCCICY